MNRRLKKVDKPYLFNNIEDMEGAFFTTKNGYSYHTKDCGYLKKADPDKLISFQSEDEAIEAGYLVCGNCYQHMKLKD